MARQIYVTVGKSEQGLYWCCPDVRKGVNCLKAWIMNLLKKKSKKEEHIDHMETQRNISAELLQKALKEMELALEELKKKEEANGS
jgi:Uri superfamily endonuclease